ncbi:family 78 glycoside hydrolase catalytic domain [Neobacillus sp. 179-J 1A1 HS]|uniref:family 78 glycoside hydrolase catalytic domain n=1 Tax=Neobacillus driksii TaxID=3035913 RepID=UPI0035BBBE6E
MQIQNVLIENQHCPLGIDSEQPAFTWSFVETKERGIYQTAYRILVSEDEQSVKENNGTIWDSGLVKSRRNMNVLYQGSKLESRKRYFCKVKVWDQNGEMTESPITWWEMGLLHPTDWTAEWISKPLTESDNHRQPIPQFRYEFNVEKPIKRARIYISGLGHYELRLNGSKVEDRVLEPGWTQYDKTCLYSVYDVTSHLTISTNVIGVILGNGFYHVSGGRYVKFKDSFGEPTFIAQLEIHYMDGTVSVITSNTDWMSSPSPTTFSCIYGGEDYDARLEQSGWDTPHFTQSNLWKRASKAVTPKGKLRAQKTSPLKVMKVFAPVEMKQIKPNVFVADLGQNFSGWVKLRVKGLSGASVKLIPAELLNEDGSPNQTWTGSPYEYNYTLKGTDVETWNPLFTYYGFRYVQIEGAIPEGYSAGENSTLPQILSLEGQMIYPDFEASGSFESSDTLLNRTHELINWAILSNTKSVFTDCPHREKLGWLEQVHLMGHPLIYNYPVESLLSKVMDDTQDAQLPNGMVPTTAPEYVVFEEPWDIFRHSVSWGATYILAGWMMYQKYGNTNVLQEHYENMKKYIQFIEGRSENYIVKDGLGDWYDVGPNGPGFAQNTPVPLPETAMFYHLVQVLEEISRVIDKKEDTPTYIALGEEIKAAYNKEFFIPATGQYATGSQAANAMSLALDLVEKPYQPKVLQNLIDDIVNQGFHTTSGDVAHRFVLLALAENDRSDIIFKMTRNTDYPSYGYQIEHGATALTEAWDGPTVGKSQNHFMLGHLEEWLYSGLAGLNYTFDPIEEAYQFTIKPYYEKTLQWVKTKQELYTGKTFTHWKHNNHSLSLEVQIPANSTGEVYIPAASIDMLKENGVSIFEAEGVEFVRFDNGYAVLQILSGHYLFESILVNKEKEKSDEHPTVPNTL